MSETPNLDHQASGDAAKVFAARKTELTPVSSSTNMQYTDLQLQLALAKMLPKKITELNKTFYWRNSEREKPNLFPIQDTEWLHVCWLVEETLMEYPAFSYSCCIKYHSPWQQRAIALAKVKGVEIE